MVAVYSLDKTVTPKKQQTKQSKRKNIGNCERSIFQVLSS